MKVTLEMLYDKNWNYWSEIYGDVGDKVYCLNKTLNECLYSISKETTKATINLYHFDETHTIDYKFTIKEILRILKLNEL
jgi:hypothetical protein